jgi:hypothetical protein
MGGIMSECVDTVTSLMPSSSSFDGSDVQEILDHTVGPYFDDLAERVEEVIDAPFLTEATGEYLDILHGKLYGITREYEESDDDYRSRMIFQAKDSMRVPDLLELGCKVYAYVPDFDVDSVLTSRNTSLSTMYIIKCPNQIIEDLIKDNLIWEGLVTFI